ncbi:MAG: hypothetical protein AB7I19_10400 [Planctomycetota bacterium]
MHPILIPFLLIAAAYAPTITSTPSPAAATLAVVQEAPAITLEPGTHELRALVNTFAVAEDCNYLFQDSTFGNTSESLSVRLQSKLEVRATELRATLERLLYSVGIVIVPLDSDQNLCEIIALNGPRRGEYLAQARPLTADALLSEPDRYDAVITTAVVDGISAAQVANMLRPFLAMPGPNSITLSAVSETKIAIAGTRRNVAAVLRILNGL